MRQFTKLVFLTLWSIAINVSPKKGRNPSFGTQETSLYILFSQSDGVASFIADGLKKTMYTEAAYVFGVVLLALGTALMTKADFGLSMVVAPAYIVHVKLSVLWPFFSFGMASYVVEGILLMVLMLVVRRFKVAYLFSFVTALLYGVLLDAFLLPVGLLPIALPVRLCCFMRS